MHGNLKLLLIHCYFFWMYTYIWICTVLNPAGLSFLVKRKIYLHSIHEMHSSRLQCLRLMTCYYHLYAPPNCNTRSFSHLSEFKFTSFLLQTLFILTNYCYTCVHDYVSLHMHTRFSGTNYTGPCEPLGDATYCKFALTGKVILSFPNSADT